MGNAAGLKAWQVLANCRARPGDRVARRRPGRGVSCAARAGRTACARRMDSSARFRRGSATTVRLSRDIEAVAVRDSRRLARRRRRGGGAGGSREHDAPAGSRCRRALRRPVQHSLAARDRSYTRARGRPRRRCACCSTTSTPRSPSARRSWSSTAAPARRRGIPKRCAHSFAACSSCGEDETLLVQSGKPVGVFRTHPGAPRVLIANSLLVPRWATWDEFRRLEALGLTMYGQMTAGQLDLHRHAGDPAGHVPDVRGGRRDALRLA